MLSVYGIFIISEMANRGAVSEEIIVIIYLGIGGKIMLLALQVLFGVLAAGTGLGLIVDVAKNRMDDLRKATGKQWAAGFTVGIIANFLDTLGCGSYAPSTFMYKLFNQMDDIDIPGTLNVGDKHLSLPLLLPAILYSFGSCTYVQPSVLSDLQLSLRSGRGTRLGTLLDLS